LSAEDDPMMPPPDVIEAFMKHCRCCICCRNPPCAGVMAGGFCDSLGCVHDDEDDRAAEDDDEDFCPVHGVNHSAEPEWTREDEKDLEFDARWRP
jgi:hypothetical protein